MRRLPAAAAAAILRAGCGGRQSALDPAGAYAGRISTLWWIFFGVCAFVWIVVVTVMLIAVLRRRRDEHETSEGTLTRAVAGGVAATVLILFVLLFFSTITGTALSAAEEQHPIVIEITGQQWWWEIEYKHTMPSLNFPTANEIYIPTGQPVRLILTSRDVIHSFWIPSLHGKRDLFPGRKSVFTLHADRPGIYEGQCAEFCGAQHAKMRLSLIAVPPDEYARWAEEQRRPAPPPRTPAERRGQTVFMSSGCPLCHTIAGTLAQGKTAPDLTHLASRRMIAANSVPNVPGHLAGWILDPQTIKPGNHMPPNLLPGKDLQPLLAYLGSLK